MDKILFFTIGTIFGSFFGVMIDRLPDHSIILPRSHCGKCGQTLKNRDLIPLISQVLSHSKCRYCGTQIPFWYASLEFLTGLIFLFGLSGKIELTVFLILLASILLTGFDLKNHSFPLIIWLIFFICLLFSANLTFLAIFSIILGILTEFSSANKIGSGDWLYLSLIGFSTDFFQLNLIILIASLSGILYYLFTQKKQEIAFLPFLFFGYLCLLFITPLL
ncbi:prepilin peptidase [Lactococcus hodotermopsidis]|uniref:prepilin peptidase n=1 Tax=Pseudolactococcus hodotermopsidis TaxID=2709157 RepID=UPI0015561889|nr:A24 family peptidase [Lactococcus hodotermopsidis]